MDLTRLHTDDRTPPAPAQSPADGSDAVLHNAAEKTLETGTETGSEPTIDPPEPSANISKHDSLEINSSAADSDAAECFSLHPEPAKEGDFRHNGYYHSSGTIFPLLSQMSLDLLPPSSDVYSENTERSVGEPLSTRSSEHSLSAYLRSSSQESDTLGSDTAAASITELYIFESETQDFILSTSVEPPKTGRPRDGSDSSVEAGTHHAGSVKEWALVDCESHVCQQTSPTVQEVSSVTDAGQGSAEVSGRARRSDSPVELWLDACQYLTAEDTDDRDALDKTGVSVTQEGLSSDVSFPSEETRVSRYNPDRSDGIGCFREDTRGWGPPVERWSSVDSWESALSHWSEIVTAPPEDITAAFTEIGAEIDALTQALAEVSALIDTGREEATEETQPQTPMGVQDKPLDTENIPESSILSGQRCLSFHIHSSQTEDSAYPTDQHSSLGSSGGTVASPGGYSLIPGYVEPLQGDMFVGIEEHQIILNIIEDTDLVEEDAAAGTKPEEQPRGDGVCEVTDVHALSQPVSLAKQEAKVDCDETEASTDPVLPDTRTPTHSHVSSVNTALGPHVTDPSLGFDGERQVEPQWGSPQFIMPLAPLWISSSLLCQTTGHLEGDQTCAKRSFNDNRERSCDHVRPFSLLDDKENTADSAGTSPPGGQLDLNTEGKTSIKEINHLRADQPDRVSDDPLVSRSAASQKTAEKMPHKAHKNTSESKARSKKEKPAAHHHGAQASRKQEGPAHHVPAKPKETHIAEDAAAAFEDKQDKPVSESVVPVEKAKLHGKKKKKHGQNGAAVKSTGETPADESSVKPKTTKGRIDMFEAKMGAKGGKAQKDNDAPFGAEKKHPEAKASQDEAPPRHPEQKANNLTSPLNDDAIKRRRLSQDKFGKLLSHLESKLPKSGEVKTETPKVDVGAARRKAYSEVVRHTVTAKEDPRVVQPIQAASVSGDPQGLCLWCQFAAAFTDCTVSWRRDGAVLAEVKRSAGDESRVSLTISNASHKDLGKYQCCLSGPHGAITLDYLLTYEVLSEIVIPPPPKSLTSVPVEVGTEEEDVQCSRLMFKEDFLSDQYFDPVNHTVSIITEKAHFGEGMHRRAFRTKLQAGQVPLLLSGHSCVLKVHNSISYGTKNNDELVQKNFTLAVEECQVQNTAREYIKAYTAAAQSVEAFGEIPEIIPIYLVHRPSNDIPYATLEEELIGDFVKYSVKDGKEINLMRRDSEAGRKCCAFQHWVYHNTEGNLLVTDMQGVGMKLTDVGIATCKKGYKGFKGNCATSFIDQFKALHQCNNYCEILGLKSLQPKPRKPAAAPKAKAQPAAGAKKKAFGPTMKGKS